MSKINACPLCNSNATNNLFSINRNGYTIEISDCNNCSFIFQNTDSLNNDQLYTEGYYSGESPYSYIDERLNKIYAKYVWDARIHSIHSYIKNGNFLDIGCSFGGLLESAEKYFIPHGIEISNYSGDWSKKRFGDSIHIGEIFTAPFPNDYFSVITLIEVIEHIQDPIPFLQKCRQLCKNNALIVIQTADIDAWQAVSSGSDYHYYLPGHFSYFSEKTLTQALNKNGFQIEKVFRPVDFGLLPKLKKARGNFSSILDYRKWFLISWYHLKSFFSFKGKPITSSMVIYARAINCQN